MSAWAIAQAGLAWGEGFSVGFGRCRQVLAAPTQRKLALLVGINHYAEGSELRGCLTDVELQRELLIHRFGFHPADIVSLTGEAATRDAIATAFLNHLVEQSQAGDVVLFHFSGYGNLVRLPSQGDPPLPVRGLVPSDGLFPTPAQPVLNCLLEETLELLVRSLATEQVTLVLDTSHHPSTQSLQGNLRGRSLPPLPSPPSLSPPLPSLEELALQSQLRHRLLTQGIAQESPPPGVILRAARPGQVATEIAINGAFSGLLTYALTQSLWATTPARRLYLTLTHTAEQMAPIRGEAQQLELKQVGKVPLLTYGLLPESQPGIEGLITQHLDETTLAFNWVGLPRAVLQSYGLNSILAAIAPDPVEKSPVLVQLRSQKGVSAIARILKPTPEAKAALAPGQGLQEVIRVIPRKQGLILALDPGLERIERVDATSALSAIKAIAAIVSSGEGFADCLLAAISDPPAPEPLPTSTGESSPPIIQKRRYGLFSEGGVRLPNTAGKRGEAIKSAVGRLEPQWNQLLAAKLWNLTQNENSTRLKVRATLEVGDSPPQPLISKASQRQSLARPDLAPDNPALALASSEPILPQLPGGSSMRFRLENNDTLPLYYVLLGLNSNHQAIAHLPLAPVSEQLAQDERLTPKAIAPGATVFIPASEAAPPWQGSQRPGFEQWLLVFTRQPCERLLAILNQAEQTDLKPPKATFEVLSHPQAIAQALLADLHQISQVDGTAYEIPADSDSYLLDVQAWASLNFVYQIH